MRTRAQVLSLLLAGAGCSMLWPATSAEAQISISIGINVPAYPELVLVPGYPVYYAPRASSNYFFFDGLYWVYQADSWYDGPWDSVAPEDVPLFVLRVPVRYYRQPPAYFRGWSIDAPPRWGEHWGGQWESRRSGWDRWDRGSAPPAAPLPAYQRQYSGDRYPRAVEQQHAIRSTNDRYQPREPVAQQHLREQPRNTGSPAVARVEPQQHAPAPQGSAPPPQQVQANQQRHDAQPVQLQPARAVQQTQSPATTQHNQAPGQEKERGHENRAAPQQGRPEAKAEPHDRGRENKNEDHGPDRH